MINAKIIIPPAVATIIYIYLTKKVRKSKEFSINNNASSKSKKNNVGINGKFISHMKRLIPIIMPSIFSVETSMVIGLGFVLIARTWLDIWFSAFNAKVVRSIVGRKKDIFLKSVFVELGFMMWPLSVVNNSLKLLISSISLAFRQRLTTYAHEAYFNGKKTKDKNNNNNSSPSLTFYRLANIDNRIQNCDQLLTQDIEKFCDKISHLYADISKPLVDVVLFTMKLAQAM